ncbi:MAG: SDR family NAD(P)-dependent oxidoreductase [Deltaproteobacteria bacterium]|nr:SDR family NAD(P)-dependent oxidoreductase [Deltaproteobacteria bacterium]
MAQLAGRVSIVTGAGRGIGKAISLLLARSGSRVALAARTEAELDALINNAGWGRTAPVTKAKVEDWDRTFQVNLRAPMILSQMVLPTLIARGEGAVINIGSISGKTGQANTAAYCASKFGLVGFTESLYEEVREYGIKVAVILPGFVDTPLIPVTRRLDRSKMIRPEDIAQAVLFILTSSPAACPIEITVRPQRTPYT